MALRVRGVVVVSVLFNLFLFCSAQASEVDIEVAARALAAEKGGATSEVLVRAFDRVLNLSYRAEHHQRELESKLDRHLRESGPVAPITVDEDYRELRAVWAAREDERHDLEALTAALARLKADAPLAVLNARLRSLTEADRLQVVDFLQTWLQDVGSRAQKSSMTDRLGHTQWYSTSRLTDVFRRNEGETAGKARAAAAWNDWELEADLATLETADPSLPATGATVPPKVRPSPDSAGNFSGTEMSKGDFVLTFDDGPSASSTPRLLGLLSSHRDPVNDKGAPATFFVLASRVRTARSVLEQEKTLGFSINNHSWDHANFAKLDTAGLTHQIVDSGRELKAVLGRDFRFFRCPYGACYAPRIPEARQMIADQGLIHAFWTIDSLDWKNIGHPERTAEFVIKQIQSQRRGVILLHDIHQSSVDATKLVLDWIQQNNASEAGAKIRLMSLEDAVDKVNANP